mmetsp:Transcript_183716/g.582784  ORF Transcript_183716/g.582784 Transcript_183716/m.582784 type:complete len:234 (+) Transcript_183716:266-967(+)
MPGRGFRTYGAQVQSRPAAKPAPQTLQNSLSVSASTGSLERDVQRDFRLASCTNTGPPGRRSCWAHPSGARRCRLRQPRGRTASPAASARARAWHASWNSARRPSEKSLTASNGTEQGVKSAPAPAPACAPPFSGGQTPAASALTQRTPRRRRRRRCACTARTRICTSRTPTASPRRLLPRPTAPRQRPRHQTVAPPCPPPEARAPPRGAGVAAKSTGGTACRARPRGSRPAA